MDELLGRQLEVCRRFGVDPHVTDDHLKVGIARNVRDGIQPLNGLRLLPDGDTTGWYIWAGEEISDQSDFFAPLHLSHLREWCPDVLPYLQLPPGWRFQIAPEHEDVWLDDEL